MGFFMRIENVPPILPPTNVGDLPPEPPEICDAMNQLWAIFHSMGQNWSSPSFDFTGAAANAIHTLVAYWKSHPPPAGSEDAIVNKYLTSTDPVGGPSIADLCTPGSDGKIPNANILTLQSKFADTDSFETRLFNIVTNEKDTHYWFNNVNYSYSWSEAGGTGQADVQNDIDQFFNGASGWDNSYNNFSPPDNFQAAQKCANLLIALFESLKKDGAGSSYTDLLENMWNLPLESPPGSGNIGDSLAAICEKLAHEKPDSPSAKADAIELYNMLVKPYGSTKTNDLNATLINYIRNEYFHDLITPHSSS
jgi:hypothetical protein